MIVEIEKSGYQNSHQVWTNPNAKYRNFTNFNYFKPSLGWSSGPTALWLASTHCPKEIYILGFDYTGNGGKFNNVYADTVNYKKSNEVATYYGNWQRQTETVIKSNPHIKYFRVVDSNYYDPGWRYENFKHILYDDFKNLISTWKNT